jgi:hypothetical protein
MRWLPPSKDEANTIPAEGLPQSIFSIAAIDSIDDVDDARSPQVRCSFRARTQRRC